MTGLSKLVQFHAISKVGFSVSACPRIALYTHASFGQKETPAGQSGKQEEPGSLQPFAGGLPNESGSTSVATSSPNEITAANLEIDRPGQGYLTLESDSTFFLPIPPVCIVAVVPCFVL
jgi:hypothetical protein